MKLSLFLTSIVATNAYDIGCLYPDEMPDPIKALELLSERAAARAIDQKRETPVVVRLAHAAATCGANCLAYHDSDVLNVLTLERTLFSVPPLPSYQNSFSRMLCIAQCLGLAFDAAGDGEANSLEPFWEKWGIGGDGPDSIQGFRFEVAAALGAAAAGDTDPLTTLLASEDFHPFLVGQIVFFELGSVFQDDGWNSGGALTYDIDSGDAVDCTGNCLPYSDISGYYPKNNPTGKREPSSSKYVVEGRDKHWQPLSEAVGVTGGFAAQMHVTPHIGYTAKTYLVDSVDDFGVAPDPKYDYREEALQVVEQLKDTSSDETKKQKIAFFDDKLLVRGLIQNEMHLQFGDAFSFEDELLFNYGIGTAEYDGIISTWREKVRYDLVRPTTVIQRWGSDVLNTYSGDKSAGGPVDINARDFQAFQRVMPHSEYPSASSCLCKVYGDFTDAFSNKYYGGILEDLRWGDQEEEGFTLGCDSSQTPLPDVSRGCGEGFVVPDMSTLDAECGDSRLWAGLHFTKAVPAGQELCSGLGDMALELEKILRNGSDFGSKFVQGDPRPTCVPPA